jgi:hypothetical protein
VIDPQAIGLSSNGQAALERITEAVNDSKSDPSVWIGKKGIKLRLKEVSVFVGMEAMSAIQEPEIPKYYDTDAERERENPLDPHYLALVKQTEQARGVMAMNINVAMGTEIIYVPEDIPGVNNQEWSKDLDALSNGTIKIPESGITRYIAWLRYIGTVGMEFTQLSNEVMRYSGVVTEEDITKALSTFQNKETGDSDNGVPTETGSEPES